MDRVNYSAEYGGELADHLPMARSALRRMGASAERIEDFTRTYVAEKQLRPLAAGDPELVAREAMVRRLAADGRGVVLREELRSLAGGIGAGAFHALIRVAYGLADGDDAEIAAGLVYWRHAWVDLGSSEHVEADAEPFDASAALLRAQSLLAGVPARIGRRGLIADRMAAIAAEPEFEPACGRPRFDADSVGRLAGVTARAFAATSDFTLLHAMTATHALRVVLPFADDADSLLQPLWRAYVAAYASAGTPAIPEDRTFAADVARVPAWPDVLAAAVASDDEHDVKAAFTAWSQDGVYDDPIYRVAAARYLRLL